MNYTPRKPPQDGEGPPPDGLGDDLLRGAKAIAKYVFGDERHRRKVFHLVATGRLPIFRIGSMICARRQVLLAWIEEQERRVPSTVGGHHRRGDERKGKPDEPTPTPACPPPRPRGPAPAGAARVPVPADERPVE